MKPSKIGSPWGTREERKRTREIKIQAVLHAAVEAFNEKGFYETSLDDIARKLHVTKPTIYHYFSSKNDLLRECILLGLNQLREGLDQVVASDSSPLEKVELAVHQYAKVTFTEVGIWTVRAGEDPLSVEARKEIRKMERYIDSRFRALIEGAVAEGHIIPCNSKIVISAIAGTINWVIRWYKPTGPLTIEEITDQVYGLLLNGLLVRDSSKKGKKQQ